MIFQLVVSFALLVFKVPGLVEGSCSLYLAPSRLLNAGRGVFAGREYVKGEEFEHCPCIAIPKMVSHSSQFESYVFDTGFDKHDMMIVGPANIYNHFENRNVDYFWRNSNVIDPALLVKSFANLTETTFCSSQSIAIGQEMLNYYGPDWFKRFEVNDTPQLPTEIQEPKLLSVEDLETFGHCLSDVRVEKSSIGDAGRGVFAARHFLVGEVVTVTPLLALYRKTVEQTRNVSVLINYCMGTLGSDLLLYPVNYGALINHAATANVELRWYDWTPAEDALNDKYSDSSDGEKKQRLSGLKLENKLQMTVSQLTEAPFAQLDFAYVATRAIAEGEELFLDYGTAWEEAWVEYNAALQHWDLNPEQDTTKMPLFRQYIEVPSQLYSPQWFVQPPHCARDQDQDEGSCDFL